MVQKFLKVSFTDVTGDALAKCFSCHFEPVISICFTCRTVHRVAGSDMTEVTVYIHTAVRYSILKNIKRRQEQSQLFHMN